MSFPPFDSSASSHNLRYPQPVPQGYSFDQPAYGHMGYADMSQSGQRYPQTQSPYSPVQSGAPSGSGDYDSYGPSYSPTAAQFAQSAQYGPLPTSNSDDMTYAPRRRHQSASAVGLSSDPRYPTARRQSEEERMPPVQEGYDFAPTRQVPSQPYYDSTRPAPPMRSSSNGQSSSASALALEKPYICDICQTRFARHHDCRRHRETHVVNASGEKPHHCVVCGKSFTRKDALKRHTNQKGCDINAGSNLSSQSSRSSSSSSPQQVAGTFYPVGNLPHGSGGYYS